MIISTFSDIHLEFVDQKDKMKYYDKLEIDLNGVDVLCLCGDIDYDIRCVKFAEELISRHHKLSVVLVDGNHSFYRNPIENSERKQIEYSKNLDRVHYLANDSVVIDGIRFIGSCLWTDFDNGDERAIHYAWQKMNDYKQIRYNNGETRLSPYRAKVLNEIATKYIVNTVNNSIEPCAVMTHHKPYLDQEIEDMIKYAYQTDLVGKFTDKFPKLFLYGHCHSSEDNIFSDGDVEFRVVSNPIGYYCELNKDFKKDLKIVLDI